MHDAKIELEQARADNDLRQTCLICSTITFVHTGEFPDPEKMFDTIKSK